MTTGFKGLHDEITGGLFVGPEVTVIEPQFLLVESPLESVEVIVTVKVPVEV